MGKLYRFDGTELPLDSAGLTENIKSAFVNCFKNVAWLNNSGKDSYDELIQKLDINETEVVKSVNTLTKGIGYWTTNDTYMQWESNKTAAANISAIRFRVGDKISIGDYETYKFKVGTGNTESSSNGQSWATEFITEDLVVISSVIEDIKTILIKRVDDADLTNSDLTYLNSHVNVYR